MLLESEYLVDAIIIQFYCFCFKKYNFQIRRGENYNIVMSVVANYLQVHRVSVLPCKKSPVTEANEFHTSRHVTKAKHRSATLLRLVYCITVVGASPCVLVSCR